MRITTQMFYDRFLNDFTKNMEAIFKSQEQISSMKKLNRPSDDPAAMSRVVGYKTQVSAMDEYKRAIGFAGDSLGSIDTGLSSLNNLIIRAKELALQGSDGSATADERATIAKEIGIMLDSAVDIANTRIGDKYIFGGYKSNVTPVDKQTGEYLSDSNTVEIDINTGTKIGVNIPASQLFSFRRNQASDSSAAILSAYANDADPNSALYSSAGFFVIGAGNSQIVFGTAGTGVPAGTATLDTGMYTGDQLAAEIESKLETADAAGDYTVSFDSTTKKFTITNATVADRDLLWSDPSSTAALTLGFKTENAIGIPTSTSDISDNATGFTSAASVFTSSGGTLTIKVGDDDTTPVDVTISAGATLAEIKNAINTANAGVKAEVVDMGTGSAHDYRIVMASDPVGRSGDVRITASTNDPAETGLNTLVYMSSADSITINSTNNQIVFNEGNGDKIIYLTEGSYNADQLASMVKSKMEGVDTTVNNIYTVTYDSSAKKYKIINNPGNVNLDMKWEDANSSAASVLGYSATDHALVSPPASVTSNVPPMAGAGAGPFIIDATNNTVAITEGGKSVTATISVGTYNTGSDLAAALKAALESVSSSANTYTVSYDSSGGAGTETFSISSMAGNTDDLTVKWTDPSSLNAAGVFKFNADSSLLRTTLTSDNALTYGMQSNTFDYNVKNYNYIEDASNSNYYSFNNNYLNGTIDEDGNVQGYILRALNFLKISLENNDSGRIQKAVDYLDRVADKVFKAQAEVGSRMNKLDAQGEIFANRELDIALYMSNDEDADIAKAASDMAQRQTALQGLRTASAEFMRTSLFDFLK